MSKNDLFPLDHDLPRQNPWRDDRLGYAPFAERLFRIVKELRAPNGYVIGLHGEWGSGKTTALNFLKAFLEKHNQETEDATEQIGIVDFRPWIVSGHQDLVSAFFKILSDSLKPDVSQRKQRRDKLFRLVKRVSDPLIESVATVALLVDPTGGVASKAVATVARTSSSDMIDKFLTDPSLQAAYENLRKALLDSGKRFLAIIDDLDRLQPDEIRSIMQMAKTVGQLPNVVYVLAYDREIVWRALQVDSARAGPKFAEKIIQQEIELPAPTRESLLAILDNEIGFLFAGDPNWGRWHYIVVDGVRRWIRHPRDISRLANAIKFSWPALKGELDPQDLLAMEGLRLFDPIAFEWARWNRDFLFAEGRFAFSTDDARQLVIADLKQRIPSESTDQLMRLLSVLFPRCSKSFEGAHPVVSEPYPEVAKRRGVGCVAGYDAYFGLHPSHDAVQKSVVDDVIAHRDDEEALVQTFEQFLGRADRRRQPLIGQLFEEIQFRFYGHDPAPATTEMLNALSRVGERVCSLEWRSERFGRPPSAQLSDLIGDLLSAWDPDIAGRHLSAAFEKSKSPAFNADIFVDRARELGAIASVVPRRAPLVTREALAELGTTLLSQIDQAVASGELANAPYFWDITTAWKYLSGAARAKAWISEGTEANPQFFGKVLKGLVGVSTSKLGESYTMRERPDEELYDLHVLRNACQRHLLENELSEDQKKMAHVVASALANWTDAGTGS